MEEDENMKQIGKAKKNSWMLVLLVALIGLMGMVSCASAASAVEAGTIPATTAGLVAVVGIVAFLIGVYLKFNNVGVMAAIIGLLLIVVGGGAFIDLGFSAPSTGETTATPDVDWDVSINSAGTDNNYNDDENTFTSMIYVNKTSGTILDSGNASYTDPVFNWTVSPTQSVGVTETQQQATGLLRVSNPSYSFSDADATDTLYLFSKASSGEYDVTWTADGGTSEEQDYVTVSFGGSEYVTLEPEYRDAAVKYLDTGDSISWTVEVCGETYTATVTVVNAWGSV